MPKEFRFRGYKIEELQNLSMDDFISLLSARQRRSLQRGLSGEKRNLLEKIRKAKQTSGEKKSILIRTHCRDMIIFPEMIGSIINVYNGREFVSIEIQPSMVGHYLGEYAISNKPVRHGTPGIGASRSSMYVPLK